MTKANMAKKQSGAVTTGKPFLKSLVRFLFVQQPELKSYYK
jgi:hypothetical protein